MGDWSAVTEAVVVNAMPTDLAALYATWLTQHAGKAGRLAELCAETVGVFRDAVRSNPANELDADETTVPTAGFRHAVNVVLFDLGMEMGINLSPEAARLIVSADVWLRGVQRGEIPVTVEAAGGNPSFGEAAEREARVMLWGV